MTQPPRNTDNIINIMDEQMRQQFMKVAGDGKGGIDFRKFERLTKKQKNELFMKISGDGKGGIDQEKIKYHWKRFLTLEAERKKDLGKLLHQLIQARELVNTEQLLAPKEREMLSDFWRVLDKHLEQQNLALLVLPMLSIAIVALLRKHYKDPERCLEILFNELRKRMGQAIKHKKKVHSNVREQDQ